MRSLLIKIFLILSISAVCFCIISAIQDNEKQHSEKITVTEEYVIKEYDGKIAVYINQNNEPYIIYDTYISLLPEADQNRLKSGIVIYDSAELQKIIEDYTS